MMLHQRCEHSPSPNRSPSDGPLFRVAEVSSAEFQEGEEAPVLWQITQLPLLTDDKCDDPWVRPVGRGGIQLHGRSFTDSCLLVRRLTLC